MKILIADDSEKNRELLRTVLGHLGHTVIEAADGREAVALAETSGPDLFILDLQMPVMDGFAAMRAVRAMEPFREAPVLALTAYAMEGDREKALSAGFSAYLTKPLRMAELRTELARWAVAV
jgi:two-component system, cell cycle response regulator DivK